LIIAPATAALPNPAPSSSANNRGHASRQAGGNASRDQGSTTNAAPDAAAIPAASSHEPGGQEPSKPASPTDSSASRTDHGPVSESGSWTTNPFVVAPIALVILIALALHFVHISTESKLKQQLSSLGAELQRVSVANRGSSSTNRNAVESLSEAVERHEQTLVAIGSRITELDNRAMSTHSEVAQNVDATRLLADWLGNWRIQDLSAQTSSRADDVDRRKSFKIVAGYKEAFAENAKRVLEARDALDRLVAFLNSHPHRATDFVARVEALRQNIQEFERWDYEVGQRLRTLELVPFDQRLSAFRFERDQIAEQLTGGRISAAMYVEGNRRLVEHHFPFDAQSHGSSDPCEHEQYVRDKFDGTTDYLMDWFDRLYQLRSQAKSGAYPLMDAATVGELAEVYKIAEETLARFDIQPEEIDVGLTNFDRRLHDTALVMQRSNVPANTIVGVQQCGFRRLPTGDVLRRPRVIVSGAGAL